MSHSTNRSYKVHYKEYLTNRNEPDDDIIYDGAATELDVGLIKSSYQQRQKLRRTAERLRRYAL